MDTRNKEGDDMKDLFGITRAVTTITAMFVRGGTGDEDSLYIAVDGGEARRSWAARA